MCRQIGICAIMWYYNWQFDGVSAIAVKDRRGGMKVSGMNGVAAKKLNRQQVLRLLSLEPGISRTEIAHRMGLVKMTVSNIVIELLRSGMVCEKIGRAHV